MQPPLPSAALLGRHLPPVPEDLNCMSPLKELYDAHSDCGNLDYVTTRVLHATSQDDLQWSCSLVCPAILQPFTGEPVLQEHTSVASGRSKKEAEQRAAYLALCRIAKDAPGLGVKPPDLPAMYLNLSSDPLPSTASPSTPESSTSGLSWSEYETVPAAGSSAGAGSMRSTGGRSSAGAVGAARRGAAVPSAAATPAATPSGRPSDAEIDAMDAGQLRQELKSALRREARLRVVLGSLAAAAAEALG